MSDDGRLWAITAYFNPCRYQARRENFRTFREQLRVPLVAVELVYDGRPELGTGDADTVVHVAGADVLWQKERLLNVALDALPDRCEAVAWLDCDLVFGSPGWETAVRHALDAWPLVQPFRTVHDLPRGMRPEEAAGRPPERVRDSLAYAMAAGRLPSDIFSSRGTGLKLGYSPGHAWAARRSLLRSHGFYDAFVMGGGDKLMASAAFGHHQGVTRAYRLNARQTRHYLEWAVPFAWTVDGRVGFTDGTIYHLWHGDLGRRRYADRYNDFERFDFDPYKDIRLTASGGWGWSSDKPEMHDHVLAYFAQREEDGHS